MATRRKTPAPQAPASDVLARRVVDLVRERRGEQVVVLDVRGLVDYMDYLIIASGRSARQNQSIAEHVVVELKREHGLQPLSVSGAEVGAWICVDLVDVVLHVFEPEQRAIYDLELLWADAARVET